MIDAYASQPNYLHHLLPVWEALPEEHRGTLWLGSQIEQSALVHARGFPRGPGPRLLVASYTDLARTRQRRHILMEHGAGQSYPGQHPSYAGGHGRETVDLFLVPGPYAARANRAAWPRARVEAVGCPALDRWHRNPPAGNGMVAVTWHWDLRLHPNARWAWPHFHQVLPELARCYRLVGHAHPRAAVRLRGEYERLGIPWVGYDAVMAASVLVVDNSSAGFEFASLGGPVVWMQSPYYRDLDLPPRFPRPPVGEVVADPAGLCAAIDRAIARSRVGVNDAGVYDSADGRAAERAAGAIVELEKGAPA